MNERDAFLRGIREAPDDDAPRLVFADWLDEHGEPARAEFIRVQCELAELDEFDPRRDALEDRATALLARNERAWVGDWPPGAGRWVFRRGFVESAGFFGPAAGDALAAVRAAHPVRDVSFVGGPLAGPPDRLAGLRGLSLWNCDVPAAVAPFLAALPSNLGRLALGFSAVPDALVRSPALPALDSLLLGYTPVMPLVAVAPTLAAAPALTQLRLDANNLPHDGAVLLTAPSVGRWRHLSLSRGRLGDAGLAALLADPRLKLDALNVRSSGLGAGAAGVLARSPALAGLRRLDIAENERIGSLAALADAPFRATLRDLSIGGELHGDDLRRLAPTGDSPGWKRLWVWGAAMNDIANGDTFARALLDMPGVDGLRELTLSHLTPTGVRLLASRPWPALTSLALPRCEFGTSRLRSLADSGAFPRLATLDLGRAGFEERELVELAWSSGLPRLSRLEVWADFLSPSALVAFAGSPLFRQLTHLDVGQLSALPTDALAPLTDSPNAHPLLEVVRAFGGNRPARACLRPALGLRFVDGVEIKP